MNLTTWRRPSRIISPRKIDGFFGRPLRESHAFLFETNLLELPPHGGSFSLKLVLQGEEEYFIGRRTVRIRPGDLLLINAGESYGSRIRQPCRSLSIFFAEPDLVAAQRQLGLCDDAVANVPQIRFSASRDNWRRVIGLVHVLRWRRQDDADEVIRSLLAGALGQLRHDVPVARLANVRKRWTRDELIGRMVRVREYIENMRGESCSLDQLAEIACLSRFHFLRVFKEVFGHSPVAFARSRRMRQGGPDSAGQN